MDKRIVVYSQPGWMFCTRVKEFLSQKGVPFVEHDVSTDEQALADLAELGYMTTPVTTIDGEVVIGFDRRRLEALLEWLCCVRTWPGRFMGYHGPIGPGRE